MRFVVPVFLLVSAVWAQKKQVNLDAVMAVSQTSPAPVWSPDGARFVLTDGTRVVMREVASRTQREVVDLKALDMEAKTPAPETAFGWENRRARERAIQWSGDARKLLVARTGDLFLVDVASGERVQLTRTPGRERDAKLSPDGKLVAFRLDHDLYAMDVASRKIRALTKGGTATVRNGELDWVYPEELAISTAYWWSPDSKRIAYLQFDLSPVMSYPHGDLTGMRPVYEPELYPQAGTGNPKVRLGIVPAPSGATKWMDLPEMEGGRLIARVEWLPDSSGLAVALLNRVQNELRWVRADGKTVNTMHQQKDPAWVNFRDDYRFLAKSDRMLLGAETPDFRHLYWKTGEAPPKAITSGDWEVTDLNCVDEAREVIYYTSTEASPLERHLYRIKFDGSGKTRLTTERGTHTISMPASCVAYVDTHSSVDQPPRRTLHSAPGGELVEVLEERKPVEFDLLPTELTHFSGRDGATYYARLIKPAGFAPGKKYPVIVQVYGGPHAQNVRDQWRGVDYDQYLAQRGFLIWQMDNRGTAGRGHVWESRLYRRLGKQELEDQLEGVRHLVSLGFADPVRVGINGWSYGGFMTLYSLFNAPPETFAAGIAGAPVTDWRQYDTIYTERYLGTPQQNEDGYRASSPVFQADKLRGKLMLVHNFEDDNVLFQHSLRMADALQRAGKDFDLMLYPQKAHGVTGPVQRHMLEKMTAFWERHLSGPPRGQ